LKAESQIVEQVGFPNSQSLLYGIKLGGSELTAIFEDHAITISIPFENGQEWIDSDQVGIETHLAIGSGKSLHLLLEKDFPCKDRPEEDKTDLFQDLAQSNSNC
jgi:hypothetical protein